MTNSTYLAQPAAKTEHYGNIPYLALPVVIFASVKELLEEIDNCWSVIRNDEAIDILDEQIVIDLEELKDADDDIFKSVVSKIEQWENSKSVNEKHLRKCKRVWLYPSDPCRELDTKKTYLVTVDITCGEYEKLNRVIVQADSMKLAENYAMFCECHDKENVEWLDNGTVKDLNGEFMYEASAKEIHISDVESVSKYFDVWTASVSELFIETDYIPSLKEMALLIKSRAITCSVDGEESKAFSVFDWEINYEDETEIVIYFDIKEKRLENPHITLGDLSESVWEDGQFTFPDKRLEGITFFVE